MKVGTYIIVVEGAEHLQFTVDALTRHEALEYVWNLLESNAPSVPWIRHSPA